MSVDTHDPTIHAGAIVMPFRPRVEPPAPPPASPMTMASLQARALALEVLAVDQNLSRIPGDLLLDELRAEIIDRYLDRAAIAVSLGDPLKRSMADEKAAIAVVRGIAAGIETGLIKRDSPLALVDISTARIVAKLALVGGFEYLAARERRP